MKLIWISLAGAIGSLARYWISGFALTILGSSFPYGTLIVNIIGSFLIGAIMELGLHVEIINPTLRLILATGFVGGFTTYSAFNYETLQSFQNGEVLKGFLNIFITVISCLVVGYMGFVSGRWIAGNY